MNETGYDLVAHKHYRHRVINIVRIGSKLTGYKYFVNRDRKSKGIVIFRRNSDLLSWIQAQTVVFPYSSYLSIALTERIASFQIYHLLY